MLRFLLTTFFICLGGMEIAYAKERLLASDGKKAELFVAENYVCEKNITIKIVAQSVGYFDQSAKIIQRKVAGTASAIFSFECPKASNIFLEGYTDNVLVFKADASKKNRWRIQTEPAPLERIALLLSLQEPSFLALGTSYAELTPYKNITGMLESYQYSAYEKQIHRMLSIIDGDSENFKDYLKQAQRFEQFEDALTHYKNILAVIKKYDPEQYSLYQKTYDEVAPRLQHEYWQSRVAVLLEDGKTLSKIILEARKLTQSSNTTEFKAYIDQYLSDWIAEEKQFIQTDIENAPLYEVEWVSDYLDGFPEVGDIKDFPKVADQIQQSGQTLMPLLTRRINALQELAIETIKASGSFYTEVDTITETGFALSAEFEEAGYTDISEKLLTSTVDHINMSLKANIESFKKELSELDLNAENTTALQQQATVFEDLSGDYIGFSDYKKLIDETLTSQQGSICVNILKNAGASQDDASKNIIYGNQQKQLSALACELYENGHSIAEFKWNWLTPKTYFMTIKDSDGIETQFELAADQLLFADNLTIVKRFDDNNKNSSINSAEWEKYIAKLILPPPSGKPDVNGVRECDQLAADPFDPNKRAKGVDFSSGSFGTGENDFENFDRAIDACIAAVEDDPSDNMQEYQLGRLFWYSGNHEQAKDYIDSAAEKNYAPAKYYQAQILLSSSEEQNDFVDALNLFKDSGKGGYERAIAMLKELNPDGIEFYKQISPPKSKDITAALGNSYNKSVSIFGVTSYIRLTGVNIKDCFQTSATDFSCEYKKVLDCGVRGGRGFMSGLMNMAMQSDCNSVYESFDNFRKLTNGVWKKLPGEP